MTCCNRQADKPKIEKFVWIQHNLNWIWDTTFLQARKYVEYIDSTKEIHYAKSKIVQCKLEKTDFFYDTISDTLRNLIFKNLYKKTFPQTLPSTDTLLGNFVGDGDYTCIIYKFKNEPEHIINYLDISTPDSLKDFIKYVERLPKRQTYRPYKEFDIKSLIKKYRQIIVGNNPLAPAPAPDSIEQKVRFTK